MSSLFYLFPQFFFCSFYCSDIFNLPLPALWTAVLGEHNRDIETGYERRVPIDKIITHSGYLNFEHDIVLLKLARPVYRDKKIRKICLPLMRYHFPQSLDKDQSDLLTNLISMRKLDKMVSLMSVYLNEVIDSIKI